MSKKKYARQKKHQQKHNKQARPKPVVHRPEVFCFVSTDHKDLTERHTCMERYEHTEHKCCCGYKWN